MKAVYLEAFGGPETLRYGELPDPAPGPGQALVRVRACALNHLDLWVRGGLPAYKIELPHILGSDIAGELAALGPGTDAAGLAPGERVIVSPGVSCWGCAPCREGRDNLCDRYAILGADGGRGGYAELAVVPARNLLPAPSGLGFAEAASLPLAFLTAYHMLKGLARVRAGETVLVLGAGAGVAVAGIQIAKALGARVIAASSSEEKLARARALGADEAIGAAPGGLPRAIRRLTGGRGVDAVFEHVGGESFGAAVRCLAPGGRLITCGATAGPEVPLDLRFVFFRELAVLGAKVGPLSELRELLALVASGKIRPVVDKRFPLAEARAAHEHLAAKRQFGKVVLTV